MYKLINNNFDFSTITSTKISIDTETTGLNFHSDKVRLLQFCTSEKEVFIIDLFKVSKQFIDNFNEFLKGKVIYLHNAKFDIQFLWKIGIDLSNASFIVCTYIISLVINNGLNKPASLKALLLEHLDLELSKEERLSNWEVEELTEEQLNYAALDVYYLQDLAEKLKVIVDELKLNKIVEIECNFIPCLAALEYNGLYVNVDNIIYQKKVYERYVRWLERAILKKLPNIFTQTSFDGKIIQTSINLNSKKVQLLAKANELQLELANLKESTLKRHLDNEAVVLLIKYSKAVKAMGTYTDNLLKYIEPTTNRTHPSYNQLGALTGRMTTRKCFPILTIPRDKKFKQYLEGEGTNEVLDIDYSSIETRLVAYLANENNLLEVFRKNQDAYVYTAAIENGYTYEELLEKKKTDPKLFKDLRQGAKSEVLGLSFSMGVQRYVEYVFDAFGVVKTVEEGTRDRDNFFSTYPRLPLWHKECWYKWREKNFITNINGRRWTGDIGYNVSINFGVQSLATDIIKVAQRELFNFLKQEFNTVPLFDRSPLFQTAYIHDAVTFEGSRSLLEMYKPIIEDILQKTAETMIKGSIPMPVEGNIGKDYSCH